ncbi:MAG: hypothetical protein EBZ51_07810 [Synechococcaceae bacterium WB9_2_112]|nr:hypothetical protein [Synechococcaceae bacterium WB9_2_112]
MVRDLAMYLGKKVLVVPMHTQYEQHCNAAGAATMGATVIPELHPRHYPAITDWLNHGQPINVHYPDITADIVARLVSEQA